MATKPTKPANTPAKTSAGTPKPSSATVQTKIVYRHRNFAWCIFAVVLAFLLGILSVFAAIGVALGAVKSKDVISAVGLDPNEYIAAEYQDKSLLDLGVSLVTDAQSGTITSVNGLAKYSPKITEVVDGLLAQAESFGVKLDKETLCATNFTDLVTYLQDTVLPSIELGGVLGLKQGDSNLVITLCYGKEGVDFTYDENGKIVMAEGKTPLTLGDVTSDMEGVIGKLTLGDVLTIDETSAAFMQALKDTTITDLTKAETINNLTLGNVLTIDESSSAVMQALKNTTIGNLAKAETINSLTLIQVLPMEEETTAPVIWALRETKIGDLAKDETVNGLKLSEVIAIDESSSAVMQALKDTTIGELASPETINNLTLGQVLTIDGTSSAVMQALKDTTIGNLASPETINNLTLGQVLTIDETSSLVMQALKNTTIGNLASPETINALTLGQVLAIDESSSLVMQALKNTTIGDLAKPETANNLRLSNVVAIDASSPRILQALSAKGTTIGNLGGTINTLTLNEILGEEEVAGNKILKNLGASTIDTLATDIANLTIEAMFGDEIYCYSLSNPQTAWSNGQKAEKYTGTVVVTESGFTTESGATLYRYTDGVWYLLIGADGAGASTKVTELATLVDGVSASINNTILKDLYVHGILTTVPNVDVSRYHYNKTTGGYDATTYVHNLNELTITETIGLISFIASLTV